MKESPHKKWVEELYNVIEEVSSAIGFEMEAFVKKVTNAVPESEIIERLMNIDMPKEKVVTAIHAANVLITLVNVPEIYTRCKIHDYIIKEYNNTFSNGITNELIKNLADKIKIPFPEFVITFEKMDGDKYSEIFYSIFENTEKYVYYGKTYPIYTIKELQYNTEEKDHLKLINEFIITPPMLPRVYINCMNVYDCPYAVRANPFKKSNYAELIKSIGLDNDMCQKTHRTHNLCKSYIFDYKTLSRKILEERQELFFDKLIVNNSQTKAERSIESLLKIFLMLKRFSRIRMNHQNKDVHNAWKSYLNNDKMTHFNEGNIIYLTEKSYRYIKTEPRGELGYTRESPCEHYRRAHYRKLKNGKIVFVKATTVCAGNKKSIKYVL